VPDAVVIDAMFMINTRPLRRTTTIPEYGKLLFHYILEHFRLGTSEVHLVFDNPSTQMFNPKQFEQVRRHNNNIPPNMSITCSMLTHQFPKGDGTSSWIVHPVREA